MVGKAATIAVPILAVALIGTGMWGYQEHQEKNAILIKAENQYQQAFHDLTYYMDSLHEELGKSIAVNSRKQLGSCLTNAWRLAYAAQSSVGQLPLTLMPFNKTEELLSRIGDFTYRVAVRDLHQEPLNQQEWKTLNELYRRSGEIKDDLRKMQAAVLEKNLRWMDVEIALATEDKQMDNTIIDGFKLMDKRVEGYEEIDFGIQTQTSEALRLKKLKELKGTKVTEEEAREIAARFLGASPEQVTKTSSSNQHAAYAAYDLVMDSRDGKSSTYLEVTRNGGHVVWMLNTREMGPERINLEQAETKALRFVRSKGISDLETAKLEKYGNVAVITLVKNDRGIRVYPEAVIVKVALDNGQIVGYSAADYLAHNQKSRSYREPKLSYEQAKSLVNPNFSVQEHRLAVIIDDRNEEVLCYELTGTINKQGYRIYLNAENGEEEKVELVRYPIG